MEVAVTPDEAIEAEPAPKLSLASASRASWAVAWDGVAAARASRAENLSSFDVVVVIVVIERGADDVGA